MFCEILNERQNFEIRFALELTAFPLGETANFDAAQIQNTSKISFTFVCCGVVQGGEGCVCRKKLECSSCSWLYQRKISLMDFAKHPAASLDLTKQ